MSTPEGMAKDPALKSAIYSARHPIEQTSKVLFTVRRNYFDMIRQGLKTNEIRRASKYWRSVAARQPQPTQAIFFCGRQAHSREILKISVEEGEGAAEKILGRPLSSQGVLDVGTGSVVVFWLGQEIP